MGAGVGFGSRPRWRPGRQDGVRLLARPHQVVLGPGHALDLGVGVQGLDALLQLPVAGVGGPEPGDGLLAGAVLAEVRASREDGEEEHDHRRQRRHQEPRPLDAHARMPFRRAKAPAPGKAAASPRSSSMRRSWLYFATRSDRAGAPVLIWPQLVATARSAMVVSSVSPERWDITAP